MISQTAVIIVNHGAGLLLVRCLEALALQSLAPRRVILVDNASPDLDAPYLRQRFPWLEIMALSGNLGFAVANNLGVTKAADCPWVALLNPDAFPHPGWLEALETAAYGHPEFSFFASRQIMAYHPQFLDGTGDMYHVSGMAWRRHHGAPGTVGPRRPQEVFGACAAAALYNREAFLAVGGFDESYFCYFEDVDLSFRLRLAGHRCLFLPQAAVEHVGSALCGRQSDFAVYHGYRNQTLTFLKNMPGPLLWFYLPQHVAVCLLELALAARRGQGGVVWRSKLDALRRLASLWRERRKVQQARRVSAATLRMAMSRGLKVLLEARRLNRRRPADA